MTPPDPRGVAGLVADWRAAAEIRHESSLRTASAFSGASEEGYARALNACADQLAAALAASPVSQPTVGGEAVATMVPHVDRFSSNANGSLLFIEPAFSRMKVGDSLYLHPASVEPVSQDAEGFVLVPVEPTDAMVNAGSDVEVACAYSYYNMQSISTSEAREIYAAMIAAARQEKGR